ncbi:hypothetical protein ACFX13_045537 [Malus domestica]
MVQTEFVDRRVIVQLVEELCGVFRAQLVHQYSPLAEKVDVLAQIDEIIHQDSIRRYLVEVAVVVLLEGDEVPEERPCPLVDCKWWNSEHPVFELHVHYENRGFELFRNLMPASDSVVTFGILCSSSSFFWEPKSSNGATITLLMRSSMCRILEGIFRLELKIRSSVTDCLQKLRTRSVREGSFPSQVVFFTAVKLYNRSRTNHGS